MNTSIQNSFIKIDVSATGAELKSLFHKIKNREYLWQGDPAWWPRNAPVLFPIVGKLSNNEYHFEGRTYPLPQHGFARDGIFELVNKKEDRLRFVLRSGAELQPKYPFQFELVIEYTLKQSTLETMFSVRNVDEKPIFFSIGAHPGFALNSGEGLPDYYIELDQRETLDRHLLDEGLFNGKVERVVTDSKILDLNDDLMKKDAIVFKHMKSTALILRSHRSDYFLKFESHDFPYFGIWAKPGAPFVCLEPWCGLADNKGFRGDLKDKEGIVSLEKGEMFQRSFTVEI